MPAARLLLVQTRHIPSPRHSAQLVHL